MDGDAEHMVTVLCPGHPTLSRQRTIGWNAEGMWAEAVSYINARHADDERKDNDDEG
jgi:hypothetical protein